MTHRKHDNPYGTTKNTQTRSARGARKCKARDALIAAVKASQALGKERARYRHWLNREQRT